MRGPLINYVFTSSRIVCTLLERRTGGHANGVPCLFIRQLQLSVTKVSGCDNQPARQGGLRLVSLSLRFDENSQLCASG